MSVPASYEQTFARLESEVNRVLEQTGRLFTSPDAAGTAPLAQVSKLKQTLQTSNQSFHDALDELEIELQTARLVLRRDLAICRDSSLARTSVKGQMNGAPDSVPVPDQTSKVEAESTPAVSKLQPEDDLMQEAGTSSPNPTIQAVEGPAPAPAEAQDSSRSIPAASDVQPPADIPLLSTQAVDSPIAPIETQAQARTSVDETEQPAQNDEPTDPTAFSTANDLDSLFGGPSALPGDSTNYGLDSNDANDFDFDVFANSLDNSAVDADNLSSLLPGLEDYANTQPNGLGDTDFDAIFAGNFSQGEDGQQGAQHRNSTFEGLDDILDFNVGDFGAGDGAPDGNGENANGDFDFSMS